MELQRVFYNLQISNTPVSSIELLKYFKFGSFDFFDHEAREFNGVSQDNFEAKIKVISLKSY